LLANEEVKSYAYRASPKEKLTDKAAQLIAEQKKSLIGKTGLHIKTQTTGGCTHNRTCTRQKSVKVIRKFAQYGINIWQILGKFQQIQECRGVKSLVSKEL